MFRALTASCGWPALRRFVTILCAASFMMISSAHAMNHFESFVTKSAVTVGVSNHSSSAESSDPLKQYPTPGAENQNCCCCSVATTFEVPSLSIVASASDVPNARLATLDSIHPNIDTPYPIILT